MFLSVYRFHIINVNIVKYNVHLICFIVAFLCADDK